MATKDTEPLMQQIEADRAHDLDRLVTLPRSIRSYWDRASMAKQLGPVC